LQLQIEPGPCALQPSPALQVVTPQVQTPVATSQLPVPEPIEQSALFVQPQIEGPAAPHVNPPA
jgi:hypothetical protein